MLSLVLKRIKAQYGFQFVQADPIMLNSRMSGTSICGSKSALPRVRSVLYPKAERQRDLPLTGWLGRIYV